MRLMLIAFVVTTLLGLSLAMTGLQLDRRIVPLIVWPLSISVLVLVFWWPMRHQRRASRAKNEETAYAQAAAEIERQDLQQGLWAKALADADGDPQKQKALYLRYRAAQLIEP